jgi:hypothetical protein
MNFLVNYIIHPESRAPERAIANFTGMLSKEAAAVAVPDAQQVGMFDGLDESNAGSVFGVSH